MRCSYCAQWIDYDDDDFLECIQCKKNVHIKCLRHASTPGDLLGDVFFDFTCAKCMELQYDRPSTSAASGATGVIREKFARQRLPWLMVITLALYNLSIKSKGLSHHGYFHWRSHIASFIHKNWDYLFDTTPRRRKNWNGTISGNLSHNSPDFFISGHEVFNEPGWWKLTYSGCTPKYIYKKYEEMCLKRRSLNRIDKRSPASAEDSDAPNSIPNVEIRKRRRCDSEEELIPVIDSCSRTLPYMGRKPKVAKQLNIVDDDVGKNLQQQQQQPLNTVQSSLMDFLAENLANDDLALFNNLPSIVTEPLVGGGKDDFLPFVEANTNLFDIHEGSPNLNNNGYDTATLDDGDRKLKRYAVAHSEKDMSSFVNNDNSLNSRQTVSENSNDGDEDDDDAEFQPRILQVTNFQQLETTSNNAVSSMQAIDLKLQPIISNGEEIKNEIISATEQSEGKEAVPATLAQHKNSILIADVADDIQDQTDDVESCTSALGPCIPSLFTKTPKRNLPWLVESNKEQAIYNDGEESALQDNETVVMMSEYEEKQLLQKLRKIFACEFKCHLEIPSYLRRYYRKLCIREWKREHGKKIFNLDKHIDANHSLRHNDDSKPKIIDRYQLISLSSQDAHRPFHARVAGSCQYEMFESPYSQRILHPFIYRNTVCFPPWLKLMCEIQYTNNGVIPNRATIDFCYVRPNHIAAVNALLQTEFWPGIDMSDCLSYPDFSVVALYKKLVIGCGFLVPDVGFNEAYISFMAVRPGWQRCGIATFMLYHLIQTCMTKDITLHVSATNPAVVLYQKFGFKIEELILDFYDKYLPIDSKHSRHAFFLRLMR